MKKKKKGEREERKKEKKKAENFDKIITIQTEDKLKAP